MLISWGKLWKQEKQTVARHFVNFLLQGTQQLLGYTTSHLGKFHLAPKGLYSFRGI